MSTVDNERIILIAFFAKIERMGLTPCEVHRSGGVHLYLIINEDMRPWWIRT